ncbi:MULTISPECIES: helix-turn-helix transcriptional regulator [Massilia]|uniref:AlpA family transcriptional regulator n=1 Tax=Massilia aquatica TaxID=2609000 RepID=A0ABX0M4V6_9BURK|nr:MULTISPECIES: AlpA family transcriptional regulator [Massilia]MDQ1924579.1 AlpA family transcriptional regulator [Massilia sp. CCM 9206]NHZ40083.1 AlpA family transcriptional regulator [Massilia aquatica]
MTHPKKFLRFNDVSMLVGLGRTTIYKRIKAGTFPAPIHIGEKAVAWDSAEIECWQAACIAASRPQSAIKSPLVHGG